MINMKARIAAGLGTLALVGGGVAVLGGAVAGAATVGCVSTTYCGSQQLQFGHYALDASGQHTASGTKIILWTKSNADPAEDFIMKNYNGLSGSGGPDKTFEYAPNGRASGECVTFPSTGLASTAVLEPCTESPYQTFIPLADGSYVYWKNQASGDVMEDGAFGNQGTQVDQWVKNGGDNQAWKYFI